jgi:ribosome modulation factor
MRIDPKGIDPKAWNEGFRVGRRGAPRESCPYPVGTTERLSWLKGYIEGRGKPLRIIKPPRSDAGRSDR